MNKPTVVLYVDGGVVQAIVTSEKELVYRLIDIDNYKSGDEFYKDYEADQTLVDIENWTKEAKEEIS